VAAGEAPPSNCRNRFLLRQSGGVGAVAGGDGNDAPAASASTPPSFLGPPASTSGICLTIYSRWTLESIVRAVGAFIAPAVARRILIIHETHRPRPPSAGSRSCRPRAGRSAAPITLQRRQPFLLPGGIAFRHAHHLFRRLSPRISAGVINTQFSFNPPGPVPVAMAEKKLLAVWQSFRRGSGLKLKRPTKIAVRPKNPATAPPLDVSEAIPPLISGGPARKLDACPDDAACARANDDQPAGSTTTSPQHFKIGQMGIHFQIKHAIVIDRARQK